MGSRFQPGDILAGKYVVERPIGQGGTGVVLAARHTLLNQRVAVKLLRDDMAKISEVAARFLREAQASARLTSPHVVRVMDADRLEDGQPFIVMEYLEGRDLRTVARDDGPLPVGLAARYLAQAGLALAEAHTLGIVHRDVKPSNLFLASDRSGQPVVKVLDFGISKLLPVVQNQGAPLDTITQSGQVLGSLHFMSPEQISSARDVDARTDVWSLGVTLFTLTTGRYPFAGRGLVDLLNAILHEPRPTLGPGFPPALDAIVGRCLCVEPSARYPSAAELAAELAQFAASHSTPLASARSTLEIAHADSSTSSHAAATPVAVDGDADRSTRRARWRAFRPMVAASLGVVAVAGLGLWGASRKPPRESASAQGGQATPPAIPSIGPGVPSAPITPVLAENAAPGAPSTEPLQLSPIPSAAPSDRSAPTVPRSMHGAGHPQAGRHGSGAAAASSATPSASAARGARSDVDVIRNLPH